MSKYNDKGAGTPTASKITLIASATTGKLEKVTLAQIAAFVQAYNGGGGGGDTTPPAISSITLINGNTIRYVYTESTTMSLAGHSFKKNGVAWTATGITGSGTTWDVTMGSSAISTDVILASYNSGTGSTVDGSNNELVSYTDAEVNNGISNPQLATPTGFTATATSSSNTDLAWDTVPNATAYELSRYNGSTWDIIYTGALLAFSDGSRQPSTNYQYRVRATAAGYTNSGYATANATTQAAAPSFEWVVWQDLSSGISQGAEGAFIVGAGDDNRGAVATKKMTGSFILEFKLRTPYTESELIELDIMDNNNPIYTNNSTDVAGLLAGLVVYQQDIYHRPAGTSATGGSIIDTDAAADDMRLRFERSGDNLLIFKSADGVSYTQIHSVTGVFAGINDFFIRARTLGGIGGILSVRAQGLTVI